MKIIIAGDFCPKYGLKTIIEEGDYNQVFCDVKSLISESDYAVVNLECPIIKGDEKPIVKVGPNLGVDYKAIEAIKYAGFNCVTLANNHFRDFGDEGCLNTIKTIKDYNLDYVGAGPDLNQAKEVLYRTVVGQNVAFINFCENEFSIASSTAPGSNPLDLVSVYYQILEARQKADWVIVIVHGGNEHYDYPSLRMKKTYRWCVDLGADAVINHHQHCFSGYEIYNNRPIIYGLGNFCFDSKDDKYAKWHEGYLAELIIEDGKVELKCIPYIQCRDNYSVRLLSEKQSSAFFEKLNRLNSIIADDDLLNKNYETYMESEMSNKKLCLAPYNNKYLRYACKKGYLPSFISRYRKLFVLEHVRCESLRDVFLYYLKN